MWAAAESTLLPGEGFTATPPNSTESHPSPREKEYSLQTYLHLGDQVKQQPLQSSILYIIALFCFAFFETEFLCGTALAVQELTL